MLRFVLFVCLFCIFECHPSHFVKDSVQIKNWDIMLHVLCSKNVSVLSPITDLRLFFPVDVMGKRKYHLTR